MRTNASAVLPARGPMHEFGVRRCGGFGMIALPLSSVHIMPPAQNVKEITGRQGDRQIFYSIVASAQSSIK